ncbi:MAG: chromosomal replication initiator protein DnaA [Meiothermus sp.]|uniref:chromosomal replication initiator protein DnaA n=1 Tax=Meiothermus sp. TaxID=1955249 RepID=UPI0025F6C66B|nr:chromosomal replication initiator protein DnaA [Meiothermus sp.]MCS7057304.1 chromosomal replication initiator protein DnaA [Meiothermus sp.]MCS7194881.1 chromosomal replication initiator protein DnaA [Meiothermus sp.]MCX7739515.1 chromosomal replication initiator protein DnaA [Meiothermus sp.]MDW8091265.1 chromosomal replication initiator protein DnaA [Meiothermus sp.]MDW8480384.1 chromosomal replication initiator protein DnaA [Meiothermus sp.]
MTHTTVWQNVLEYVRQSITEVEYHTWFEKIQPLGVVNGSLELGVPTSFFKGWIEDHYAELLTEALTRLGAQTPRFELKVIPGKAVQEDIFSAANSPRPQGPRVRLNPKYTFENFVVGQNNNLAHAAAVAVAESPGNAYNPLFIYGGVGLGKTHLMHAVGHSVAQRFPDKKIEYVSTETFTNELINAIREDRMTEFRDRYRSVDLLLVDDVQFIAGKERTQEEFFHTFNALYEARKQIILSSDRPPKDILTLEARLRSRFEWGLITDIQPPDLETRVAILKMNSEYRNMRVPEEVLEYIARKITSNIRELEGALMRVIAYASLNGVPLSKGVAAKALSDVFAATENALAPEDILRAVAEYYGLRAEEIRGMGRRKEVVIPRQVAMYLIRELTHASLPEIGQFFDGRDHTTVLYAIQKIQESSESDPSLQQALKSIRERLR